MRPADDEVFATGDGGYYVRCGSCGAVAPVGSLQAAVRWLDEHLERALTGAAVRSPSRRHFEEDVKMPSGSFQRVLPSGAAHVRLDLHEPAAQLVLHGRVDGDSLAQLRDLVDYLTSHGGINQVRLRLTNVTFGPGGAAKLRAALNLIDGQLRQADARLRVTCAEPLPAAAVPESLWEGD